MANNQIVPGSLGALSQANNKSIAETFLSCDCVVIVDTSGSMSSHDAAGGRERYAVACEELARLQASLPGKIGVIAFSDGVQFCPNGTPYYFMGGTDLARALQFCKVADVPGIRFIVISDGYPDAPDEALHVAAQYVNRIDTIFVGPEDDRSGRMFLERLAHVKGGQTVLSAQAHELAASVQHLLLTKG